jgi:hypothetical protein
MQKNLAGFVDFDYTLGMTTPSPSPICDSCGNDFDARGKCVDCEANEEEQYEGLSYGGRCEDAPCCGCCGGTDTYYDEY